VAPSAQAAVGKSNTVSLRHRWLGGHSDTYGHSLAAARTSPAASSGCERGRFSVAVGISFLGQYFWTFRCQRRWYVAALRFALISGAAFLLNMVVLATLIRWEITQAATAALIAATIIPVTSFLGNRLWALK